MQKKKKNQSEINYFSPLTTVRARIGPCSVSWMTSYGSSKLPILYPTKAVRFYMLTNSWTLGYRSPTLICLLFKGLYLQELKCLLNTEAEKPCRVTPWTVATFFSNNCRAKRKGQLNLEKFCHSSMTTAQQSPPNPQASFWNTVLNC